MIPQNKKKLYNTVLCQTFSPCGKFLFLGNNFGDVFVLNIENIVNDGCIQENTNHITFEPAQILSVTSSDKINSLIFHRKFLVIGTVGSILGYNWNEEQAALTKKAWEIHIPAVADASELPDINFLWNKNESDLLFAGCGDNIIYCINLEDGKILRSFRGHKDYIHSLDGGENRLFSASEDGSILFWDMRTNKSIGSLEPFKNHNLARPEFGKWQGTVSVTDDWLLCGGGTKPAMWHLRSLECTSILPFPGKVHCSQFAEDLMCVAGESKNLHEYSFNGDLTCSISISGPAAFSVIWQADPFKVLSIGGASNYLDVCTDFNFNDIMVKLYK